MKDSHGRRSCYATLPRHAIIVTGPTAPEDHRVGRWLTFYDFYKLRDAKKALPQLRRYYARLYPGHAVTVVLKRSKGGRICLWNDRGYLPGRPSGWFR